MILSKRSNGIYYIFYEQENGKRTCTTTKSKIKSDALKFLANFEKEIEAKRNKKPEFISLSDYCNRFLEFSKSNHTLKTVTGYKATLKFLTAYLGEETLLSGITSIRTNDYFLNRRNNSSIYQARKDLICLNSFFNRAIDEGFLNSNPCKNVKRFKLPQKQPLFFSESEFEKLLAVIPDGNFKCLVELAINTGMRQAEILNLQWDNVNIKNRLIILDNRTVITKSKKIRQIPLNVRCLQILNEMELNRTGEKVFTFNADYVTHQFKVYVRKAGINDELKLHSLRHTFASWLVQRGTSIFIIKDLLGHSDVSVSAIYSHLTNDNLINAVNLLD